VRVVVSLALVRHWLKEECIKVLDGDVMSLSLGCPSY
jgi:hypothetical protein